MTEQQLNDVWTYSQTEPMESAIIFDSEGYAVGHIIGVGLDPKKSAEKLAWRIIADHNLNLMAMAAAAPDYKLMPEEATPEMEQAAEKYWNGRKFKALSDDPRTWKGLYAAMRAAAPAVQGEPFAWATFDGEGGYDLMLYEGNEDYRDKWLSLNPGATYRDWVRPLYAAPQPSFQLPDFATDPDDSDEVASLWDHGFKRGWNSCLGAVAKAMQPAEQQPAPDVAGLIVLLEHAQCPNCDGSGARHDNYGEPEQCQWCHERAEALAAHRKGAKM